MWVTIDILVSVCQCVSYVSHITSLCWIKNNDMKTYGGGGLVPRILDLGNGLRSVASGRYPLDTSELPGSFKGGGDRRLVYKPTCRPGLNSKPNMNPEFVVLLVSCLAYSSILKMGASKLVRNVGRLLPDYSASHPRIYYSTCPLISE
jgi:hypothetical protein